MDVPLIPELPAIDSAASLEETWRLLMGELGFAQAQIYVLFLEGTEVLFATHLEEVPARPRPADVRTVASIFREVGRSGAAFAFLYCRPGRAALTAADRAWAGGLAPLSAWPVFVAGDDDVVVVAPDDLVDEMALAG